MDKAIEYFPLTHPQKSIWFTEKLYHGSSIGNIAATLRIKEKIDFALFARALNLLIKNNDALRIHFVEIDGNPLQYVTEYSERSIDIIDFSTYPPEVQSEWEQRQARTPFNIYDSDLFYFAILKISENEMGFFCKIHHLICDGWSIVHIGNLTLKYYNMLLENPSAEIPKEPSYIEYIKKEAEFFESERYLKDKEFWKNKFRIIPDVSTVSQSNRKNTDNTASRISYKIPLKLSAKLREFCSENKLSIFAVFISALCIYINRTFSKEDIVLGVPVLNRSNIREKNMLGMFVNTIPLRIQIKNTMNFNEFTSVLTHEWMSILKHQKYPLEELLKDIRQENPNVEKLYDIALSYQNAKFVKTYEDNQIACWHINGYQTESLYIHINDREDDGNLIIDYDYQVNKFYEKEVEFIHDHVIRVLWHALDNPVKPISRLDMVSEKEKDKILNGFNNTASEYPRHETVHNLFRKQTEKTPDNIAVVFEEQKLTYKELDERSDVIAARLLEKGVKPDEIVPIIINRSIDMIAGILGIMKSGAAYLPVDPEYPPERINYILKDSDSNIVVTRRNYLDRFGLKKDAVILDELNYDTLENKLVSHASPDNLAYVIYTSGTTGLPKGVMIEHKSIINTLTWRINYYNLNSRDVVLQMPSFSFDSSVEDIFCTLLSGAKLVMINQTGNRIDVNYIKEKIKKEGVTHFLVVPSLYRTLIKEDYEFLKNLRFVTIAGEDFPYSLVKEHYEKAPDVKLYNEYGPTENSVCSTACLLSKNDNRVLIGKPIANTKCYILTENLNIQPIGIPGELYITGPGLFRGYYKNKALTEEKLIDNPFVPGEKLYKTGDLAKWCAEGDIKFLGRIDNQIKIRGFRIELGEIEECLAKYPGIKDNCVILKEENNKKYLCAYLVVTDEFDFTNLRKFIAASLPSHMIPTKFIAINKIPLTPNGKVDRKALQDSKEGTELRSVYMGPRNEIEARLVEVFSELLDITGIGINDNIFELGIDSLSIVSVQTAILRYNWFLSTQDFYDYPTIRELAELISNKENNVQKEVLDIEKLSKNITVNKVNFQVKNGIGKNVLLTGVTGFLGIHLLDELLRDRNTNVYCLVRGKDGLPSRKRLERSLNYYFPGKHNNKIGKNIFIVDGNFTEEKFGLSKEDYYFLGNSIDVVLHAAALVKHYGDYEEFKKVNIEGTNRLVKFALDFDVPLFYVSTMSVSGDFLPQSIEKSTFDENDIYFGQKFGRNTYVKSKLLAEVLVNEAIEKGLKATILRIGNLTGRYSDGLFQVNSESNLFYNRVKAIAELGFIPRNLLNIDMEFTPVDYCSKAIVKLLGLKKIDNTIFHIYNHKTVKLKYFIEVLGNKGIKINVVENREFFNNIAEVSNERQKRHLLSGLVNDLSSIEHFAETRNHIQIKHQITDKYLADLGFTWPEIDSDYLLKLFGDLLCDETKEEFKEYV